MILFFNQVQKVAERYLGFIFLDEDYKGSKHKHLWQCKYKHKFRMSWDQTLLLEGIVGENKFLRLSSKKSATRGRKYALKT